MSKSRPILIINTRPAEQEHSTPFQRALARLANVIEACQILYCPLIEIEPLPRPTLPADLLQSERAVIVFTSANAVQQAARIISPWPPQWAVCAVGTTTARVIREELGFHPIVTSSMGTGKDLAEALPAVFPKGEHLYILGAEELTPGFVKSAGALGFHVTSVPLYRTVARTLTEADEENLRRGSEDRRVFLFFSPSAVRAAARYQFLLERMKGSELIAIGPTTADAVREATGASVVRSPETPGSRGVLKEISRVLREWV